MRTVTQHARIASSRKWRNVRIMRPGSAECAAFGFLRTQTPSKGVKRTATIQDMINAMATTAKIEKVYSPAALRGSRSGVYVGVGANEYSHLLSAGSVESIEAHFITGNALNVVTTAGHNLEIAVTTPSSGCGQNPANAQVLVAYN